ncbi:MAG TPA: hypothetical protein VG253_04065 [Streptosporangiaceae bacterium]|nr:hypothetical protein [Streptosporangiaceae bacterium]
MSVIHRIALASVTSAGVLAAAALAVAPAASAQTHMPSSFIGNFHKLKTIGSTVPKNGDVNPYGTVVIRHSQGKLQRGNVLISNFNNANNLQGTGTTIVQVSPAGKLSTFAHIRRQLPGACPGGVGLTTALATLNGGWVVVGSLPTTNGMSATAKAGCLIVLDSHGNVRETIAGHGINGPWDMTAISNRHLAELFVTNVLNGTVAASPKTVHKGTVVRLVLGLHGTSTPKLLVSTTIGSGFGERTDPAALVVGPTGVGLNSRGTLFVADSVGNRITAIRNALFRQGSGGTGRMVTKNGALNTPLGLAVAPNGDVLTVNAGDGKLLETTPGGKQVATRLLDNTGTPPGNGALFGLAVAPHGSGVYYVDDAANTLRLLH